MIHITIVYDDNKQKELVLKAKFNIEPTIEFYNINTKDGKKGYKIKGEWGARKNPFVLLEDNGKPIKAFYSENDWEDNAIIQLINWLKNVKLS